MPRMSQTPPDPHGETGDLTQPVQARPTPGSAIPPASSPYPSWASEAATAPQVDLTKAEPQPTWSQPAPPVPYGQPNAYGQQPYPPYAVDHPQTTTVLILGILGLILCSVLAPFAWVMGNRVVREIDASQGQLGGRSSANAGRICGIIGSVLLALSLLAVIAFFLFAAIGIAGLASTAP
jgi:hypothetical protein